MRWLKRSLHSVLFCTFVWQLAVSISNLRNGKSSTKISNVEEQEQDSPSFSICYFPGDLLSGSFGPVESLSIMHDKADATLKAAIPLTYFSDNLADDDIKRTNYRDPDHLALLRVEWDDVWESHYHFPGGNAVVGCKTFSPPFRVHPSPFNLVQFGLNISTGDMVLAKAHEKGQLVSIFDSHMGCEPTIISPSENDVLHMFKVKRTRVIALNSNENQCQEDQTSVLSDCLQRHVADKMSCRLPWKTKDHSGKRPCDKQEDSWAFKNLTSLLHAGSFSRIKELTGCLNNCKYNSFSISPISTMPDEDASNDKLTYAGFSLVNSYVRVEEEQVNYDMNSFIGDVGGFLGLLLGLSILDIYDLGLEGLNYVQQRYLFSNDSRKRKKRPRLAMAGTR